ncbi:hypothetical protein AOR13_698 [Alteromonas stellipolaris LMG 21856]|nr:hypothetical protein AOR13_698 [Alteromonas stellipolaris LMG 21856]
MVIFICTIPCVFSNNTNGNYLRVKHALSLPICWLPAIYSKDNLNYITT